MPGLPAAAGDTATEEMVMGYRESAADSGYAEWDDYADAADDEPERFPEPDLTCEICGDSLTRCPHGRSDFDPVAEFAAEFDRLITGRQADPSPAMARLLRAVLEGLTPEDRERLYR